MDLDNCPRSWNVVFYAIEPKVIAKRKRPYPVQKSPREK
jgi:hypothetical protein